MKWLLALCGAVMFGSACADDSLHKAAYRGEIETVRQLLARQPLDLDERDSSGGTPLHAAMFQGNLGIVELLLDKGFDPNAVGPRNGYTPLHDAVWAGNAQAAELLLRRGARADIKGKDGLTPLMKAQRENKAALVRVFQRHGVKQ
jgi:ankyrin repeat protein